VYRLQIMNATEQDLDFSVSASGIQGLSTQMDTPTVAIGSTQARWVAVRVQIPYDAAPAGSHPIRFEVSNVAQATTVTEKSVFIVPR
jgi:hypothetical protein